MADNVLKRIGRAIVNKSHSTIGSPSIANTFQTIGSFFNFQFRTKGRLDFDKFVESYGKNAFVYQIIKKVSFTSASIKRVAVDNNDNEIPNSKILELLSKPNPNQSQIEFLEEMGEAFNTTGNVFVRFIKGIGAGEELQILKSNRVDIITNKFGEVTFYKWTRPDTTTLAIPEEEVLHIHTSNIVNIEGTEAKYGMSPLQAAWLVVQSTDEKFNAEASIFKNRGIIGILTTKRDTPMLNKERQRLQDEFDAETGGSDKFNKIKISTTDLGYIQTGMSPTDLKLLESLISSLRILAAVFGVPSIIFNDVEKSTFNNYEMAVKTAYIDSYIPLANKFDAKLSIFLSEMLGVEETIKVDLNSIEVIKASTNEVLQALNSMPDRLSVIAIQSLTDDEIREMITIAALSPNQTTIGQAAQTTTTDGENN